MPPPFRKITLAQFEALLRQFPFRRRINAVHMHHTWRPNRSQYQGHSSILGMWRFHTSPPNNWRDIAQHLTIAPDGSLWLGRSWNLPPASASGHNGTQAAGPFMFEMIGDFDAGKDSFDGPQREAALKVVALVQDHFNLPTGSLRFHNQMSPKSCPGTGIVYARVLQEVQQLRRGGQEGLSFEGVLPFPSGEEAPDLEEAGSEEVFLYGDDGKGPVEEGEVEPFLMGEEETDAPREVSTTLPAEAEDSPAEPAGEPGVQELILELMRGEVAIGRAGGAESPYSEPREDDDSTSAAEEEGGARRARAAAGGEEGLFGGPHFTPEMKEALRLHVINLSRGRFSGSGLFRTDADKVDALFEALEEAAEGKSPADPLRIVIWAHGGLVKEETGLLTAYKHVLWWQRNGVYPLYFVWETGLLEVLGRLITGRSGGEEGVFTDAMDAVLDLKDDALEDLSRRVNGAAIWSDMKQSARLAIDPDDGGAYQIAKRLAEFYRRHSDVVELHAVGHSAGAIFHASFLPTAFEQGLGRCKSLNLLAPAIRVDRFHERLVPHIGPSRPIERVVLFTMHDDLERADNCIGLYHKSLLYLVSASLEDKPHVPILGMEKAIRADPRLKALFGLGSAAGGPGSPGEAVWSKSPAGARPGRRSTCKTHGGFDDDPATLNSLLVRILGREQLPLPYEAASGLSPEEAFLPASGDGVATGFIGGEEGVAPEAEPEEEEFYVVSFDVVDAFERAAELAPDGPELEDGGTAAEGLEAPTQPTIAFGQNANSASVTAFSRRVLTDIMRAAGLSRVVISSTSRDPKNQARVMFNNLEQFGVAHQKALYGPAGDQVIEVYRQGKAAGQGAATIKSRMEQKIIQIGPTRVSRHASDPNVLNVFDVAPGSVANKRAFEQAVRADRRVSKFITPPSDPGYHLEIPQPR